MTHLSPQAQIINTCGTAYLITETTVATNPQYVTHGDTSVGFILSKWESAQ